MLEFADGLLMDFDEALWHTTVEKVTVNTDENMVFR